MNWKEISEIFGGSPLSEIFYLFTLIIVWINLVFPIIESLFMARFLGFFLIIFVISRMVLVMYELNEEEKKVKAK